MERACGRGRNVVGAGILVTGFLLVLCPCVFGLNPALDVSQYAHTSWKIRDGFAKGAINAIAQTPDGYLWLGTEFGLLRFDGVRTLAWQPPPDQHLPSSEITLLLTARDGTLWIGTRNGLASWKGSKLTLYPEAEGSGIVALIEDREGSIWAGVLGFPTGKLCAIHNGSINCFGGDGSLSYGVMGLYEDSKGNLWAGVRDGVWRWKPDPPKFYPLPGEPNGIRGLGEDTDGALLVGWNGGIRRLVDEKNEAYPLPGTVGRFSAKRLLRDRHGGLWIGTQDRGLVHVQEGRTDVYTPADGLSDEDASALFEDREGSIWIATPNGLDRLREFAVPTFSVKQGLSRASVSSVLAARDGSVWLAAGGLQRWKNGQITTFDNRDGKLNGVNPHSLFQDARGQIWVSTVGGVGYLENGRFILSGVPGRTVLSFAEDTRGNLWMTDVDLGLLRLSPRSEVQQIPWSKLGHKDLARPLAADPVQGGLWIGFLHSGIAYFSDGQVRASYTAADGLGEGMINGLQFDHEGTLWAATAGGLSRLKNNQIATLTSKNGLPCNAVHWVMEDDRHSFWLYTTCGLVRIERSELDTWAAAVDKDKDAKRTIQVTVFDSSDGVRSRATAGGPGPPATKSSDGKLWFRSLDGVSIVDPQHIPFNKLPPPVHIEQIIADRKTYDVGSTANYQVRLPPLVRDLEIDYTALSLVAPEKVRFRYKLEGWDHNWQDVGIRRQAFYNNLPPRNYRFRVSARNNSGVWNEAGTFLDFSVASAYYQTTWFRVSCLAVFLTLLAALYQLRLRQVAQQFNLRLEERVGERTRIARDFHDTLLQSFQGVLLKFHAVTYMLPERPDARKTLESVIEQARQAITEGRDAVQGLRSSTIVSNDLARAISALGEGLAADHSGQRSPEFRVQVEGTSRDLAPLVRDDIYRIAGEALRNAFRHAQAGRIEVEIRYGPRQLRLRVRDDGKGIDQSVLAGGGRAGHYGLPSMQERAKLVGGKLAVWSELDSGTEVELTIPASVAYAKSPVERRWMPASPAARGGGRAYGRAHWHHALQSV